MAHAYATAVAKLLAGHADGTSSPHPAMRAKARRLLMLALEFLAE